MGVKMSGDTMQSFNNSSRRCAHASAIFSPPGFALPKWGAGREAIVFTTRYVRQQGAKAEHTVGIRKVNDYSPSPISPLALHFLCRRGFAAVSQSRSPARAP